MNNFTIGSLFDGSGGFPLTARLCGGVPIWASEVEPYPIAVTKSRFPGMLHLGDISKVKGDKIPPVDVITFGSPCQDFSVAGKRAGLKHTENGDEETTRSGLIMEAIRIIKEMRQATNGKYPTFVIWENVPGAFTSNSGHDFKAVCEEFIKITEPEAPALPMPTKNQWPYADVIMGDKWSIAYRTFDAQYWGVAQRRRRVQLVADFRGQRAHKILFEREGLRGYFAQIGTPGQGTAANAERGTAANDSQRIEYILFEPRSQDGVPRIHKDIAPTLNTSQGGQRHPAIATKNYVRYLTPTEYARLQGFPDGWGDIDPKEDFTDSEVAFWQEVRNTHATINGKQVKEYTKAQLLTWYNKLHTDSAEYKMWGNGIALPTALYIMQGIADELMEV